MNIWILGHSLVFLARRHAAVSVGMQLGLSSLPPIQWLGMRGMSWDQLMPVLSEALRSRCQLEVLILHLGENDLVPFSRKAVIAHN